MITKYSFNKKAKAMIDVPVEDIYPDKGLPHAGDLFGYDFHATLAVMVIILSMTYIAHLFYIIVGS